MIGSPHRKQSASGSLHILDMTRLRNHFAAFLHSTGQDTKMSFPPPIPTSLRVPDSVSRNKAKDFYRDDLEKFASVLGKRMRGPLDDETEHDKAKRRAASEPYEERLLNDNNNGPAIPANSDSDSQSSSSNTSEFGTKKNKQAKLSQGMRCTDHTKETLSTAHLNPQLIHSPC
jgi:hypothetical protein